MDEQTYIHLSPLDKHYSPIISTICAQSTIDTEGFKGGTRGAPIMPRDVISRTANVGTVGKNKLNAELSELRFPIVIRQWLMQTDEHEKWRSVLWL